MNNDRKCSLCRQAEPIPDQAFCTRCQGIRDEAAERKKALLAQLAREGK